LVSFVVNVFLQGSFTHVWMNDFGGKDNEELNFHINKPFPVCFN